jgi:hypothetical protein
MAKVALAKRVVLALGLALVLSAGLAALPARAVEFRNGDLVVIEEGQVVDDDLLIAAERVVVNGTINGDLWITGTTAEVGGTVNGSLFFAGRDIELGGIVAGSAYTAGSTVALGPAANVARNLYFLGYALRVLPGAVVGRDALAAGGQALVAGQVNRNLGFAGRALDIEGSVGGDVQADVGAPGADAAPPFPMPDAPPPAPPGIRVSEDARIGGRLTYESSVEQAESIRSQPAGGVVFVLRERPEEGLTLAAWALGWLRLFVTLIALGALALFGLGAPLGRLAEKAATVPLLSVGWGILILLAGFAAAFVAAILIVIVSGLLAAATLGGLAATVFFGAGTAWAFGFTIFLLALIWGSRIVVSYLLGWLVIERLAGRRNVWPLYLLLAGAAIYSLVESIPFVGAVAGAIATVLGFGAIYLVWRDSTARRGGAGNP